MFVKYLLSLVGILLFSEIGKFKDEVEVSFA